LGIKKYLGVLGLISIFITSCFYRINTQFASNIVLNKINENTVTIAVYYYMGEEEFRKRMSSFKGVEVTKKNGDFYNLQIVIPIKRDNEDLKILAYIGSGTLLRDNHIISVKHLFDQTENIIKRKIWVFHASNEPVLTEADLVVMSIGNEFCDDYAVIKTKEDLNCKGVRIVKANSTKRGDKVIFVGSPGGVAFFVRFGYATTFKNFLKKNEAGNLVLSRYNSFPYWCIYPGGPGDSGGSIRDIYGNLISILYCGIELYSEEYIFANSTKMLWDFLKENDLEWLGQRDFPELGRE